MLSNIWTSAEGGHVPGAGRTGRPEEELGHKMSQPSPPVFCLHNKNTMKKQIRIPSVTPGLTDSLLLRYLDLKLCMNDAFVQDGTSGTLSVQLHLAGYSELSLVLHHDDLVDIISLISHLIFYQSKG